MKTTRDKVMALLLAAILALLLWSFFAWLNFQHTHPPANDPPRIKPGR